MVSSKAALAYYEKSAVAKGKKREEVSKYCSCEVINFFYMGMSSFFLFFFYLQTILDGDDSSDDDLAGGVADVGERYMQDTTLHGLKYITERRRHSMERVFWLVVVAVAWIFSAYFSYKVINKWKTSPVLVSFESVQTGIYSIPFPSLTVCNMNKVRRSRVQHIEDELAEDPENEFYLVERRFVEEICAKHESLAGDGEDSSAANGTDHDSASSSSSSGDQGSHRRRRKRSSSDAGAATTHDGDSGHIGANGDLEMTGEMLHHYLGDLGTPCHEMLLRCHFEGRFFNCSDIFIPTITDEGQCCSFNIMPESVMFRSLEVSSSSGETYEHEHPPKYGPFFLRHPGVRRRGGGVEVVRLVDAGRLRQPA